MMIDNKFIRHKNSVLHYARAGDGDKTILVFHGFGQDMRTFEFFTRSLPGHYTFYVFDLYFHGASAWGHGDAPLEKSEWKETLALFLQENQIDRFSLAGFSLGGKFVLATLEAFPEKVNQVHLIAPDGIKTSFWYSLATYPNALRQLFKSMIRHPDRFLGLARFLNRTGLVDHGLIRFAEHQMSTEERRSRVYYSWVVFRRLTFDLRSLAALINANNIEVTIIIGLYDKVITPANMKRFVRKLNRCRFEVVESGHTGLVNLSLRYFENA